MPGELPSGPVRWELDDGRLVATAPPGDIHGASEIRIASALYSQGEQQGHDVARSGEVAIVLRRTPTARVVGADAVFIANSSRPIRVSDEGYLETIPDLIVEVQSKNDAIAALERKAGEYLAAGSKLVRVIDPQRRAVRVYRPGQPPAQLGENDTLTAEGIIPEFSVSVKQIMP